MTTSKNGLRSIQEIIADLSKPIDAKDLKFKEARNRQNNTKTKIYFLPWYQAAKYLDNYAPGWSYEVKETMNFTGKVAIVAKVTIPALEGNVIRESTGNEDEDKETFGDAFSNAESMAFRRACAKFGLGRYLYEPDGYKQSFATDAPRQTAPPKASGETKPVSVAQRIDNAIMAIEAKMVRATPRKRGQTDTAYLEVLKEQYRSITEQSDGGETKDAPDKLSNANQQSAVIKLCGQKGFDVSEIALQFSNGRTKKVEELFDDEAQRAIREIPKMEG